MLFECFLNYPSDVSLLSWIGIVDYSYWLIIVHSPRLYKIHLSQELISKLRIAEVILTHHKIFQLSALSVWSFLSFNELLLLNLVLRNFILFPMRASKSKLLLALVVKSLCTVFSHAHHLLKSISILIINFARYNRVIHFSYLNRQQAGQIIEASDLLWILLCIWFRLLFWILHFYLRQSKIARLEGEISSEMIPV